MPTTTSLREQLARKRAHRAQATFPIAAEGDRAQGDLESARQALQIAELAGQDDAMRRARNWVRRAESRLAKHSATVVVRGLSEEERDALTSAHPPTDEQRAEDDRAVKAKEMKPEDRRVINKPAWLAAALTLCQVVDDEADRLTAEEWAGQLSDPERWTAGEVNSLYRTVLAATHDGPSPGIPLG
jgi:hypothetical protein